jgi:ankyrin repeat protein
MDVNACDSSGNTPLHSASEWGNRQITSLLVNHGADINVLNHEGKSPRDLALSREHHVVAEILEKTTEGEGK